MTSSPTIAAPAASSSRVFEDRPSASPSSEPECDLAVISPLAATLPPACMTLVPSESQDITPDHVQDDDTAKADFQAALDAIIHQAELQMQSLFSIHEAMQRELGDMFDRHESAKRAAQKLRQMVDPSSAKANTR
ncbi:hypothetical protein EUX98_g7411 [Antrodiella citrinella]|uniref:Uncharacterized protein n=1 Tax=Antrodiella citrinella TaxID=2447956 RepID=A0A4S4MLJ3_9APHY|nr:hypothetical protein EUX98_g7411 [Antrodiella citrinella]